MIIRHRKSANAGKSTSRQFHEGLSQSCGFGEALEGSPSPAGWNPMISELEGTTQHTLGKSKLPMLHPKKGLVKPHPARRPNGEVSRNHVRQPQLSATLVFTGQEGRTRQREGRRLRFTPSWELERKEAVKPSPRGVQSEMGASPVHSALTFFQLEPTPPSRAAQSVQKTRTERVHGRCHSLEGPQEPEGKAAGHPRPRIAGFHFKGVSGTRTRRDRDARQPEAGAETGDAGSDGGPGRWSDEGQMKMLWSPAAAQGPNLARARKALTCTPDGSQRHRMQITAP